VLRVDVVCEHAGVLGPGDRIGGYLIERRLGSGGQGVVFLARHLRLNRLDAVKVLLPHVADTAEAKRLFEREALGAARLHHPHIAVVYDAAEADGLLYIAMQYVDGHSLAELADESGGMAPDRVAAVLEQVSDALDAAHAAGLVHRDVKPANVLIARRGSGREWAYLVDFGISKLLEATVASASSQVVGTFAYMAPERFEGKAGDRYTDQYSLACTVFRCLTGELPFPGPEPAFMIAGHLHATPPSLVARRPELPAQVDQVVARAMAKDPTGRYASCGAFAVALREAVSAQVTTTAVSPLDEASESSVATHELPVPPPGPQPPVDRQHGPSESVQTNYPAGPTTTSARRRRRLVVASALVATLAVIGAGVVFAYNVLSSPGSLGPSLTASNPAVANPAVATLAVGVDLPFQGTAKDASDDTWNAMQLYLEQVGGRAGNYKVELKKYDNSTAAKGAWDDATCTENANAHVANANANEVAVMGTYNSGCAKLEAPVLNQDPKGPMLMISHANTNPGLTKKWDPGEPEKYFPSGKRSYARVVTTDDFQGPAAAQFAAKDLSVKKCFVIDDTETYGKGVADTFAAEAAKQGITVVGRTSWNRGAANYTALFGQAKSAGADCVFFGGIYDNNGGQFTKDKVAVLGDNNTVKLVAPDGFTGYPDFLAALLPFSWVLFDLETGSLDIEERAPGYAHLLPCPRLAVSERCGRGTPYPATVAGC
jgi:serine/threonine protein kinase